MLYRPSFRRREIFSVILLDLSCAVSMDNRKEILSI